MLLVLFGATECLCLDGRLRICPALFLSMEDGLNEERMRLIAKSLGGYAKPRVMDWRYYLDIDVARLLWERKVLELDQEAGARIYIFPEMLVCFLVRNTTVTMECDWVSATLLDTVHFPMIIDHWIVWERNVDNCPSCVLLATKIETDVVTLWRSYIDIMEGLGVCCHWSSSNYLKLSFVTSMRRLVPFEGADSSASVPSEREVYQEGRWTFGIRKYPLPALWRSAVFRLLKGQVWSWNRCLTSDRYGF
jgi:hypothetical protein